MADAHTMKIYRFTGSVYQFRREVPPDGRIVKRPIPVEVATADFKFSILESESKTMSDGDWFELVTERFWDVYNSKPVCTCDNTIFEMCLIEPGKPILFDIYNGLKEEGTETRYKYIYNGDVYVNVGGNLFPIVYSGMYFELLEKDVASAVRKIKLTALNTATSRIMVTDQDADIAFTPNQMGFTVDDIAINMTCLTTEGMVASQYASNPVTVYEMTKLAEKEKGEDEDD